MHMYNHLPKIWSLDVDLDMYTNTVNHVEQNVTVTFKAI